MTRTNIEVDDDACGEVMRRFGLSTKKDAVNFALRWVATEPMTLEEALAMEGACSGPDFAHGSTISFTCRRQGIAVRSIVDCLIAAVAIRRCLSRLRAVLLSPR